MATVIESVPRIERDDVGAALEVFDLPAEEAFLDELLRHVFETYWDRIVFGPMIQGAAYEIRCPRAPSRIGLMDGYLTIFFGRSHFHLCIGENKGSPKSPTPPELARHRRTARAAFFRALDASGAPTSWGLKLDNGAGEQQMTIYFPNPFLSDDDEILAEPDWPRLAVWDALMARTLGRAPDPKDRSAQGFACG